MKDRTLKARIGVLFATAALVLLAVAVGRVQAAATSQQRAASPSKAAAKTKAPKRVQKVKLVIRSDEEHGKKGPDGKWHDAYLPAHFTVHKGVRVKVTILNYDDMPHSFTAPKLKFSKIIPSGEENAPSKTTFTFVARKKGVFAWHCAPPCDPWSMSHWGFMKGHIRVVA